MATHLYPLDDSIKCKKSMTYKQKYELLQQFMAELMWDNTAHVAELARLEQKADSLMQEIRSSLGLLLTIPAAFEELKAEREEFTNPTAKRSKSMKGGAKSSKNTSKRTSGSSHATKSKSSAAKKGSKTQSKPAKREPTPPQVPTSDGEEDGLLEQDSEEKRQATLAWQSLVEELREINQAFLQQDGVDVKSEAQSVRDGANTPNPRADSVNGSAAETPTKKARRSSVASVCLVKRDPSGKLILPATISKTTTVLELGGAPYFNDTANGVLIPHGFQAQLSLRGKTGKRYKCELSISCRSGQTPVYTVRTVNRVQDKWTVIGRDMNQVYGDILGKLGRLPNHAAKIKVGQYFGVEDADIQSAILEQRGDEETDMLPLVSDQADARDGADQSEEEGHQQEEGSQATGVDDNGDGETSDSDVELVQPGVASTELEPVKDDDEDEDDEATDDEAQEWL
eukprot:m.14093 g.14093  ORF g.14093 m.14093 type:complete len:455 (-) comp6142_c0_seq1:185-1549(-)